MLLPIFRHYYVWNIIIIIIIIIISSIIIIIIIICTFISAIPRIAARFQRC